MEMFDIAMNAKKYMYQHANSVIVLAMVKHLTGSACCVLCAYNCHLCNFSSKNYIHLFRKYPNKETTQSHNNHNKHDLAKIYTLSHLFAFKELLNVSKSYTLCCFFFSVFLAA